jgi:putative copper export protein
MGAATAGVTVSFGWDSVRLGLHVLAASVWVGGQIVLAGLVPGLRAVGPHAPSVAARRFARLSWPAYAVLVATGAWNVAVASQDSRAWRVTLGVKLAVVALSGLAALAHSRARSRRGLAAWGALSGLSAVAALYLGVVLSS